MNLVILCGRAEETVRLCAGTVATPLRTAPAHCARSGSERPHAQWRGRPHRRVVVMEDAVEPLVEPRLESPHASCMAAIQVLIALASPLPHVAGSARALHIHCGQEVTRAETALAPTVAGARPSGVSSPKI